MTAHSSPHSGRQLTRRGLLTGVGALSGLAVLSGTPGDAESSASSIAWLSRLLPSREHDDAALPETVSEQASVQASTTPRRLPPPPPGWPAR